MNELQYDGLGIRVFIHQMDLAFKMNVICPFPFNGQCHYCHYLLVKDEELVHLDKMHHLIHTCPKCHKELIVE